MGSTAAKTTGKLMEVEFAQKKPQRTAITGQDITKGTITIVLKASIEVT